MADELESWWVWHEKADHYGRRDDTREDNRLNYGPFGVFSGEKQRKVGESADGGIIWEVD